MIKYAINGRFLSREMTGVDRYAYEIVRSLVENGLFDEFCLVVPSSVNVPSEFSNISVKKVGTRCGIAWEQLDYFLFVKHTEMVPVNFCNTAPLLNPGVVCIHDMNLRANPDFYSWKFRLWYRLLYALNTRNARMLLTDTVFSKEEIERYYPAAKSKIKVVSCAWQHMDRVEADSTVIGNYPELEKNGYYFAMSSLAPNKNLKWLVETARLNPDETIAIAGGVNQKVFGKHDVPNAENVIYLGYVTDGEAKALMQNCKGFLFPTFYEGFGIPPMEALSCGVPAAVSDASCMREVYDRAVHYLDPFRPCDDLNVLFSEEVEGAENILCSYKWSRSALRLFEEIEKLSNVRSGPQNDEVA